MSKLTKSQIGFLNWLSTGHLKAQFQNIISMTLNALTIFEENKIYLNQLRKLYLGNYLLLDSDTKLYFEEYYGKYFKLNMSNTNIDEYWFGYIEGEIRVCWNTIKGDTESTLYTYRTIKRLIDDGTWKII